MSQRACSRARFACSTFSFIIAFLVQPNIVRERRRVFSAMGDLLITKTLKPSTHPDLTAQDKTPLDDNSAAGLKPFKWMRVDQLLSYLILACGFLTLVIGANQILTARSVVPMWDEWSEIDTIANAPHYQPPVSWLWAQHNEHRVVFYRVLLLADIHLFRGKHSISFWTMLGVQCAFLALLVWLLRFGGLRGP